jgi:hypothetical protein
LRYDERKGNAHVVTIASSRLLGKVAEGNEVVCLNNDLLVLLFLLFRGLALSSGVMMSQQYEGTMTCCTHLLDGNHLGIRGFGVVQKDFLGGLRRLHAREGFDAVHDAFLRVLVDGNGRELALANAYDGYHHQHCL